MFFQAVSAASSRISYDMTLPYGPTARNSISVNAPDPTPASKTVAPGKIQQKVGDVWTEIRHERIDPTIFIEETGLMAKRLDVMVEAFGPENVPYAGPECGMGGWHAYKHAMEGLRRISDAVATHSKQG